MPQTALPAHSHFSDSILRIFWAALWLGLTLGTGTPQAALLCLPKIINHTATLLLFTACLFITYGHTPRGRPLRLFTTMARAWETLPTGLWLALVLWLAGFVGSVLQASMPRLAHEKAGALGWQLLLCAMLYGYAAQGWRELKLVLGGILVAADALLLVFIGGQIFVKQNVFMLPNVSYLVLYAALLLPIAIYDAKRAPDLAQQRSTSALHYWRMARIVALSAGLLLSLPPLATWPGIFAAGVGVQKLIHEKPFGWGPGSFVIVFPQYMNAATPRLPGLAFPGLWARSLVEIGIIGTQGWLLFVVFICTGGMAKAGEHRSLGWALRTAIALFLLLGIWLSPDGAPALNITFFALLALCAALRWGPQIGIAAEDVWPHLPEAALAPHRPLSRILAVSVLIAGIGFTLWRLPAAWRQTHAHWLSDQSFRVRDPNIKLKLIHAALEADPDQPAYWIHLAHARLQRDGVTASRAAASYLRVALHRATPHEKSPDAALWHEMAQLSFDAGDYVRALSLTQHAVRYDPYCGVYRLTLSRAWQLNGALDKATQQHDLAAQLASNAPAHPAKRYLRRLRAD